MGKAKQGILLVNLGTPSAPTTKAVKRYLSQFLHDQRVVDLSRWLWLPVLHGVILPLRGPKVAKMYQSIWMEEGSPLLVYSRKQQQALAARLPTIPVELAMTYGEPSISQALVNLKSLGVNQLVVLPLFPQYSCSTAAAVWDGIAKEFKKYRGIPSVHFIRDYAAHHAYIEALAGSIEASYHKHGKPDLLLFSYHGIPERFASQGDDYPRRCATTTRAVIDRLHLQPKEYMMTYQSRFGREPWLMPYTDETLKSLPEKGIKHVQVICPGFSSDCLETLEEIAVLNREVFLAAGGDRYEYIPALNDSPAHIDLLEQLCTKHF